MSGASIARLEGVSHRYGATVALDNVTIDIPPRIMVGVIGPDGVGKSTMMALISGVRKIQSGKVIVFDEDVSHREHLRSIRGRIAYMPQGLGRNLYPTLSVFENIDFFGRLFGQGAAERRARITELLTATALDPFEDRPAGKLSGGMKQKLSLCCALINDPDLLILDEPTASLDARSEHEVFERFAELTQGKMALLISHRFSTVRMADRILVLEDGAIAEEGSHDQLIAQGGRYSEMFELQAANYR